MIRRTLRRLALRFASVRLMALVYGQGVLITTLRRERDRLGSEARRLRQERDILQRERDSAVQLVEDVRAERDTARRDLAGAQDERTEVVAALMGVERELRRERREQRDELRATLLGCAFGAAAGADRLREEVRGLEGQMAGALGEAVQEERRLRSELAQAQEQLAGATAMDDDFRYRVIETLRKGEELPADWARVLFPPSRRECELVYYEKNREEDVLAETMGVPLQLAATFGKNGNGWQNMLVLGDNLQVMKSLLTLKNEGKLQNADGTSGVRLIYIDPPFATKQEFAGSQEQKAYQDKIVGAKFLEFLRSRLVFMRELLADNGSVYVHLDTKKVHYIKVLMDEVFGEHRFVNEIIWKRTNARANPNRWPRIHDTLLLYSKSKDFLYKPLKVPADDAKMPHTLITGIDGLKYQTFELTAPGMTKEGESGKPWRGFDPGKQFGRHWADSHAQMDEWDEAGLIHWPKPGSAGGFPRRLDEKPFDPASREVAIGDVWVDDYWVDDVWMDVDRINQAADEKTGYPTQKPEALLDLIVKASTKPGDLVLDAFAGSGTTCVAAERAGRRWIGIDCGKLAIYTVQRRMLGLKTSSAKRSKSLQAKAFSLYNAGLYDFSTLRALPWAGWRFFALRLFGCKDEPHEIGGLKLDGKFRGASVLVFNHLEHPDKRIDEATVQDIHAALGKKVGSRFFIVAPRGVFDFQQDYIDINDVRYYALRIPYSIINELHHRQFTSLQQPSTLDEVNAIVDAVGFDFIQPPDVEWTASVETPKGELIPMACLTITRFESNSRLGARNAAKGFDAFSTLLLDFDYNGEVFNFDRVFYAADILKDSDRRAWFPVESLGNTVMAVFIDIHGNESRVTIPRTSFKAMAARGLTEQDVAIGTGKHTKRKNAQILRREVADLWPARSGT